MKTLGLLIFLATLTMATKASGQEWSEPEYVCVPLAKLEARSEAHEGEVYLLAQPSQTTSKLNIYVINQSADTLTFLGDHGRISVSSEALNKNGVWEPIDQSVWRCGTGLGDSTIPPNHYSVTWKPQQSLKFGQFKTKVRYLFKTSDTTLISNEIDGSINEDRFLVASMIRDNEIRENSTNASVSQYQYISDYQEKYGYLKEAITALEFLLEQDYVDAEFTYSLAQIVWRIVTSDDNHPVEKVQNLTIKAISLLAQIPSKDPKHLQAQGLKDKLENYLINNY